MIGVLINGHHDVEDVPTIAPEGALARAGEPWSAKEDDLLRIILPRYGLQRSAWTLRRSSDAVQKRAVELGISYAKQPPRADTRGAVAA